MVWWGWKTSSSESDGQAQSFKRDIQTPTFLSCLTTGEPHVRPCEVVQGLKMYSSWFWLFSALWDVLLMGWPEQQCCVVLLSWCLQKEHWRGLCTYGGVSPDGEWQTNGLVLLCTDFHGCHDTSLHPCVAHEVNAGLKENLSVPRAGPSAWHPWAPPKQKPLPELKGCLFSWLCISWVLHYIMNLNPALCTVPLKSCSPPCPRARPGDRKSVV